MSKTKEKRGIHPIVARVLQIIFLLLGIFLALLGLLLLLVSFTGGAICIILAVLCFYASKRYSKHASQKKTHTSPKDTISSVASTDKIKNSVEHLDSVQLRDTSSISSDVSAESVHFATDNSDENEQFEEKPDSTDVSKALTKPVFPKILDGEFMLSYSYSNVDIAIPDEENIKLWHLVFFEHESDNPVDPNAIAITQDSQKIGYVYRGKIQEMISDFLAKEYPIAAYIDCVDGKKYTYHLDFYKPIDSFKSKTATLTKTSKKDDFGCSRQDNLSYISEGDLLEIAYDSSTETYVVYDGCGNELGELSKSISEQLMDSESAYEHTVICKSTELTDSLKLKCTVSIITTSKR